MPSPSFYHSTPWINVSTKSLISCLKDSTDDNTFTPELRFTEFKDGWRKTKLGQLGNFKGGGTPDSTNSTYWNGNTPWISSSDIIDDNIHNINISRFLTEKAIQDSATKLIPVNSVLIVSRVGIGKFAVTKENLCTSQDFTNLVTTENAYFLAYYFTSRQKRFVRLSQGTSIKGFTSQDVRNMSFALPSLPEQTKIAAFLSKVDKKIQKQQSLIEQLEQLKKGYMQRLFSQEIRFTTDNGSPYPDWTKRKLGEVGTFISGVGFPNIEQGGADGIPFLKVSDMNSPLNKKRITAANNYVNQEQISRLKYKPIMKDSIIFAKVGAAVFLERKRVTSNFLIDNNMMSYTPNGYIGFFKYLFDTVRLSKYAQTGALPSYNAGDLKTIKVNLPSLPEQTKIADFLSALDKKIEIAQQQLESTQTFKKALLQKMFV